MTNSGTYPHARWRTRYERVPAGLVGIFCLFVVGAVVLAWFLGAHLAPPRPLQITPPYVQPNPYQYQPQVCIGTQCYYVDRNGNISGTVPN